MRRFYGAAVARSLLSTSEADRVSLDDIEQRLRSLGSSAQRVVADSKANAAAVGLIGGSAVIAGVYLYGLRRGRKRATVLEVRRA